MVISNHQSKSPDSKSSSFLLESFNFFLDSPEYSHLVCGDFLTAVHITTPIIINNTQVAKFISHLLYRLPLHDTRYASHHPSKILSLVSYIGVQIIDLFSDALIHNFVGFTTIPHSWFFLFITHDTFLNHTTIAIVVNMTATNIGNVIILISFSIS